MEIKISTIILVLLYTVHCKPSDSSNLNVNDDYDMQNDDNFGEDYEDTEEDNVEPVDQKPLQIISTGQNFTQNLSESVILPCEITGDFVRLWTKKNVVNDSAKKDAILFNEQFRMAAAPNVEQLPNGSLKISNLHVQDAGDYECKAMGDPKNLLKIQHTLNVRVPPQIELLMAKDNRKTWRSGETLVLTCKATGYPKPTISWHKGSSRFDIEGETFKIPNLKHHAAGTYKCLADNKVGEPAFSFINIEVEYKPVITIERISVSSENNLKTELECLVHSVPRAQVVWMKDERTIQNTEQTELITKDHKHNVILKDLRDSDFGTYTCSATNAIGNSKKSIELVKTPAIGRSMQSQTVDKITITWEVQSKSNLLENELLYRQKGDNNWMMIKPEVNKIGNEIYEVKGVLDKSLDSKEYEAKMRSQNQNGWSQYSAVMSVDHQAKHGQHKAHKKGHKHGKDKQITSTPSLPLQTEPSEHQEYRNQSDNESFVRASESSHTSSATPPVLLIVSIVLMTFVQVGLGSMRT